METDPDIITRTITIKPGVVLVVVWVDKPSDEEYRMAEVKLSTKQLKTLTEGGMLYVQEIRHKRPRLSNETGSSATDENE